MSPARRRVKAADQAIWTAQVKEWTVEITEIRIKLRDEGGENERLHAFCSITFDGCFAIRDLKIIEGPRGLFVAMPSRKLTDRCNRCGGKNHLRARFCNGCGGRLEEDRGLRQVQGRVKLHADIAHPINPSAREGIQDAIVAAYHRERELAKLPGYVSTYDDIDAGDFDAVPYGFTGAESPGSRAMTQATQSVRLHRPQSPKGPHQPRVQEPLRERRNPGYTY
ncbi:MAG: septation protein SpoVG family protein [Gemmataceae bacterium]